MTVGILDAADEPATKAWKFEYGLVMKAISPQLLWPRLALIPEGFLAVSRLLG
jgi:hypothetical protein